MHYFSEVIESEDSQSIQCTPNRIDQCTKNFENTNIKEAALTIRTSNFLSTKEVDYNQEKEKIIETSKKRKMVSGINKNVEDNIIEMPSN